MIAMQYTIRLAGDFGEDLVRQRVRERAPLYDGLPGLCHKSFLFNESEALYAPFYIWRDAEAACDFLTGELFRGVIETFGRPRVRTWNVIAHAHAKEGRRAAVAVKEVEPVSPEADLAALVRTEKGTHDRALARKGLCCHLSALDSDRWEIVRYSVWQDAASVRNCDADMVESYEVLHVSGTDLAAVS